jgi:catechol 2,3-dioxygenase-like lactoylglutathione lyase family enzyme
MSTKALVPDVKTKDMDATKKFYVEFLGLSVVMDMGFVVFLASPDNPEASVVLLADDGTSTLHPQMSANVDDVTEAHSRAISEGREIVYPLTDEPWGVRRFFVRDPSGTIINVMSHLS